MVELRKLVWANVGYETLQYRTLTPCVDASGSLCPGGEWSEWKNVPVMDGNAIKSNNPIHPTANSGG